MIQYRINYLKTKYYSLYSYISNGILNTYQLYIYAHKTF